MFFWNRRELWMGTSMEEYARVTGLLRGAGIRYDFRTVDAARDARWSGSLGVDLAAAMTYYVYVRKEDLSRAAHLVSRSASGITCR